MKCCGRDVSVGGKLLRIAHPDTDKYDAVKDPEAIIAELRRQPGRVDLFTFMQIMPDTTPQFDYFMEMDNLAILPVSTYEHWRNQQIRSYARNRSRQAEKRGVELREAPFDDELARGIWEVYNETKVRQGKPNVHYGKDVATVRREAATFLDRSVFIGAYLEGSLIGFVKLIIEEDRRQASLMNIVGMVRHRDKAPTNALIAYAVKACESRQIPYLMYQNYVYRGKEADSLTHFKEVNGFQRIDLPRYYVPLTPLGRFALRHQLHHGLAERLPKPLLMRLRQIRKSWYDRQLRADAGTSPETSPEARPETRSDARSGTRPETRPDAVTEAVTEQG